MLSEVTGRDKCKMAAAYPEVHHILTDLQTMTVSPKFKWQSLIPRSNSMNITSILSKLWELTGSNKSKIAVA